MGISSQDSPASDFVTHLGWLPPEIGVGGLPIAHCGFEPAAFSGRLFESFRMEMPLQIARSRPKRRMEFLSGRLAARLALHELGFSSLQIGIRSGRDPDWPEGVLGSISHCGSDAVSLCSTDRELAGIGIDIEAEANADATNAIAQTMATQTEIECVLGGSAAGSFSEAATMAFSAKESLFKAFYPLVGNFFGPEAARVVAAKGDGNLLQLELQTELGSVFQAGEVIDVVYGKLGDLVMTVCCLPRR